MSATGHTRALAKMLRGQVIITEMTEADWADYRRRQEAVYAPMDRKIAEIRERDEQYWRERAAMTLGAEA